MGCGAGGGRLSGREGRGGTWKRKGCQMAGLLAWPLRIQSPDLQLLMRRPRDGSSCGAVGGWLRPRKWMWGEPSPHAVSRELRGFVLGDSWDRHTRAAVGSHCFSSSVTSKRMRPR